MARRFISIAILLLIIFSLTFAMPAKAIGLNFGGKIIVAHPQVCWIGFVPIPIQLIIIRNSGGTGTTTLVYTSAQAVLQLIGVRKSIYRYFNILTPNVSIIGQYIPKVPVPWLGCQTPVNIIDKIATSLFPSKAP